MAKFPSLLLLLLLDVPTVLSMLDYRHFASTKDPVPMPSFVDPGIAPPSYIYAKGQWRPPYDINVDTLEPFPGCDANFAEVCAVQHAIRLVTRARMEACPEIEAGGAMRGSRLASITNKQFTIPGTSGFGIYVVLANGTIVADGLNSIYVGRRIDGLQVAGLVAQPTLLGYIDWVTRWEGGFVPHYSTRISKTPVDVANGQPPLSASTYFEKCPNSEDRIGVTIGREPLSAVPTCNGGANAFCALQNIRRLVGLNLLDVLNTNSHEQLNDHYFRVSYLQDYSMGAFYTFRYQMQSPAWRNNPGMLPDSIHTSVGIGANLAKTITGRNLSYVAGYVDGMPMGDWLLVTLDNAAWNGGAWQDYRWWTAALGNHLKISLAVGHVRNGSAIFHGTGAVHKPEPPAQGPLCLTCPSDSTLGCSVVNSLRLLSHATFDFLTPLGNFDRLSDSTWFGASHPGAADIGLHNYTWPAGFYIFAVDYNGTVVAHGADRTLVGKDVSQFVNAAAHTTFKTVADSGGGWVPYDKRDGAGLAKVIKLARRGQFFYMGVGIAKVRGIWDAACTSAYSEPCSESDAQILVGSAIGDMLGSATLVELQAKVQSFVQRSSSYNATQTGDFEVHVYSAEAASDWECPTLGMATKCPPSLAAVKTLLKDVSVKEDGGWVKLTTAELGAVNAFVFPVAWSPPTSSVQRKFYAVSFVKDAPGPLRCVVDTKCPANAKCTVAGRCQCDSGYMTNFTLDVTACNKLKAAAMTCIDVRGVDCTRRSGDTCPPCAAGFFCPEGLPLPCPKGQFCPAGIDAPVPCPPGTYGNQTRASDVSSCAACGPGMFTGNGGQKECEKCSAGRFTYGISTTQCTSCEATEYQPSTGSTFCLACDAVVAGSRSQVKGSDSAADCVCPAGFFLEDGSRACAACKEGMVCEIASDMRYFNPVAGTGPVPKLQPGYWSAAADPLNVFQCRSAFSCPGGLAGTCGAKLEGRACTRCLEGFYWDGEHCVECGRSLSTPALFPLVPILIGFTIPVIQYYSSRKPYEKWGSKVATAGALQFVLLNHYQIIAILGSTNLQLPITMGRTYKVWTFTNEIQSVFKTQCNSMANLRDIMIVKALTPIVIGVMALFDYFVARLVAFLSAKIYLRMEPNQLFNGFGSLMFTFFGAIAAMSLELWKCRSNPNGHRTMFSDASVICFESDDWNGMLVISILAVTFYVILGGSVMVWAIVKAKTHFGNEGFRTRWKFLFEKYRLGAWWFGLAFLAKNFVINLALVILPSPIFQFYFVAVVIGVYLVLILLVWPYRMRWPNRVEMACCSSICLNCMFLASFAFLRETEDNEKEAVSNLSAVVTWWPLVAGGIVVIFLRASSFFKKFNLWGFQHRALANKDALQKEAMMVQKMFGTFSSVSKEELLTFYEQTGQYEQWLLRHACLVLGGELTHAQDDAAPTKKPQISTTKLSSLRSKSASGSSKGPVPTAHAVYTTVNI